MARAMTIVTLRRMDPDLAGRIEAAKQMLKKDLSQYGLELVGLPRIEEAMADSMTLSWKVTSRSPEDEGPSTP